MNTIKSETSDSTVNIDYCEETNTIEIQVGNITGFRFANLNYEKCEHLIDLINEFKINIHG